MIKYVENIGWRYDHHKYENSLPIYEYLKYTEFQITKIQQERNIISKLLEDNKTISQISKILGKKYSYITDSVKSIRENRKPRMKNECLKMDQWMEMVYVKENTVFVPVESIVEKPNILIADITTESENHSFIAGNDFCVHNSSMGKQAIGMYSTSFQTRTDTIAYVLNYPQRPLVNTKPASFMGFDDMPSGINAIVAVACYSG